MTYLSKSELELLERQSLKHRSVHPTNDFVRFGIEDVEKSIPDRFEEQVRKYPHRLAVKDANQELSYDELNRIANRIARAVLEQTGEGQEPVLLLLDYSVQMVAALLGVLKAGKTYVPLESSLPRPRLEYMLEDIDANLALTDTGNLAFARELIGPECQLINVEELDSELSEENLGLPMPPETYAYILYTSGSTGKPKGVIENHLDVLHFTMGKTNSFHVVPEDRVALLSSFCFSASASFIYAALLNGAALFLFCVAERGVDGLAKWLIDNQITIYGSVPSTFRNMLASLTGEVSFPKLRLIRLGGDSANKTDVELYKKHFSSDCILSIGIGSSEMKTFREVFFDKNVEITSSYVPVGYPLDGIEVLLLDDDGNDVGFNEIGEMVVRSRYICPGYWKSPELSAERFRPDPAGGNKRLYYTGDLGLMLPDGCLFHMGRKGFQTKIRGYRIEVGEIENALRSLESIKDAVVVSREDTTGNPRLVAYIVPAAETLPTVSELRRGLSGSLPHYMIPSVFVTLDAMPLNPNGKVDRRALPAPDAERPKLDTAFVAPRTPVEKTLAEIWSQVLGLDEVGIHDNFFELGGHSLMATQIISRVIKTLRVEVPLRSLFQSPTVGDMALVIVQKQAAEVGAEDIERMLDELKTISDKQA